MMVRISAEHIKRLVQLESAVHYNLTPPEGTAPFVVVERGSPVLLSAPHGARVFRNDKNQRYHDDEEYTAGFALLLGELCNVSVIATTWQTEGSDPNHTPVSPYKMALGDILDKGRVRYVLDLHGAALNSSRLPADETIDLGFRGEQEGLRSMAEEHVSELERLLGADGKGCAPACLVVGRNGYRAKSAGTVTTFCHRRGVQVVQIELKPQVRVARRFPAATLYRTCGDYAADPRCITHVLQSLADFIGYLIRDTVRASRSIG